MTELREFRLAPAEFARLAEMARQLAGVQLTKDKIDLVYARLVRRLRHHGLSCFGAYCDLVTQPGNPEVDVFVDALTTHVTSFFREDYHFDFLVREVWPQLESESTARVWSAGCSTGQEPYSLAISLNEKLGGHRRFEVTGTDISVHSINVARRGVYASQALQGLSVPLRRRYFQKGVGDQVGLHRVKPEVKRRVKFSVESLLRISSTGPSFDVIMCRNVLIYFSRETAVDVCRRFTERLRPGGYLILGHSEGGLEPSSRLRQVGPTCYRKVAR